MWRNVQWPVGQCWPLTFVCWLWIALMCLRMCCCRALNKKTATNHIDFRTSSGYLVFCLLLENLVQKLQHTVWFHWEWILYVGFFSSAAGRRCSIGDWCVCLCGCVLLAIPLTVSVWFSWNLLGRRDLCANVQKTVEWFLNFWWIGMKSLEQLKLNSCRDFWLQVSLSSGVV